MSAKIDGESWSMGKSYGEYQLQEDFAVEIVKGLSIGVQT
jgi:hypothetical protein